MGTFAIPAGAPRYTSVQEYFRGVDMNNSPSNVDPSRSPSAPNMIRDQVGKVRKRMGYTTAATAPNGGAIHGVHTLGTQQLIHAGTALYQRSGTTFTALCGDMADGRSASFVFDGKMYLLDGVHYRVYDGESVANVSEGAYVPTVMISRAPAGGGTVYEALNLLGTKWTEQFLGTAADTEYQLTATGLDDTEVECRILNGDGEWVTKTEGTDFTVNRTTGVVTFTVAPGLSPVTGMDNVKLTPGKTREGDLASIDGCTVFAVYGVGGACDRVFLSGNSGKPGMDWYSGFENPAYFPDTGYTKVSRDGSAVAGYAILSNTLATFLTASGDGRNILVRQGSLDDSGEAVFRVTNTLIGESAIAPGSFAYMGKEPLFLTKDGVYAITAEELTGEKYTQERSFFVRNALHDAGSMGNACACIYRDFYVLGLDGKLYLLDGQQKSYEKNNPYSSYQYEAYYWPDIAATCLWTEGEALCFGTSDGKLKKFGTNVDTLSNYNDDGAAIEAYWETSDFDGKVMFRQKTITAISVRLAAASTTGVKVYAQKKGIWAEQEGTMQLIFDAGERARYFDWEYVNFEKLVFSSDRTPHTLVGKVKIKKVDKVRFRLQNSVLNEPMGLYAFGLEWKETGKNYKG